MDINRVIEDHLGIAYKQLANCGLCNDPDAVSLALEALWNAAMTYKRDSNTKFSTYAYVCVYNAIGGYIRHLKRKRQLYLVSYDAPIIDEHAFVEVIPGVLSSEDTYLHEELAEHVQTAINKVIESFSTEAMQQLVRFWIDSNCTAKQRELSEKFGVSQSYASRVLSMAKYRLKKELEEYVCEK